MSALQRKTIAIIGAGQAGAQAVQSLRAGGYDGRLYLFGEEGHPPYQRPPLSKKFLAGELPADRLSLLPEAFFTENEVTCEFNNSVIHLDPGARRLELADGAELGFDRALIATGSRPRPLAIRGVDHDGIFVIRNLADVNAMRPTVATGGRAIIIGGGYIGLEVAAICRGLGLEVVVIEATDRLMARTTSAIVGRHFEALHRANGVEVELGTAVLGIDRGARGELTVETDRGDFAGDLVLIGIGAVANDGLARRAGLTVENGIVVDACCRTSAPDVFAAGDCASFPSARYRRRLRLESVQNAVDQAKAAALAMLDRPANYDPVPWFWSDQYDVKLHIAGLSQFADREIVRGDPQRGSFAVAYLQEGRLIAVDAINRPRDYMQARRVVPTAGPVDAGLLGDGEVGINEAVMAGEG
jgi:3-phenylpropionate/trans-cinnamate dioxygenase ferredoxin reductase subunit